MKILVLANVPLPQITKEMNLNQINSGGWVSSFLESAKQIEELEFIYCFCSKIISKKIIGNIEAIRYYGFPLNSRLNYFDEFKKILNSESPDLLHIFGTEFYHSLAMVKAFDNPNQTLIHIQGLTSIYATHFTSNLPCKVVKKRSFRDLIKSDGILKQQKEFIRRGLFELEAIASVNHIVGRTEWDMACTKQINPRATYHKCNEILRDSFYNNIWNIEKCEKRSIFISSASYPIKGFHNVLEAINITKKQYPDTKVYVAGNSIIKKNALKESSYAKYLKRVIRNYNLDENIFFLGSLNDIQMCKQYLKANVFVSASSIENSPNSLAEAMILGVPVVSSYVGGVMSMLEHGKEGFLYQADAPYMLAHYIMSLFFDDVGAAEIGSNGRKRASATHDRNYILEQYYNMYKEILK